MSVVYMGSVVRVMVKTNYNSRTNCGSVKQIFLQMVESESDCNSTNNYVTELLADGDSNWSIIEVP